MVKSKVKHTMTVNGLRLYKRVYSVKEDTALKSGRSELGRILPVDTAETKSKELRSRCGKEMSEGVKRLSLGGN